MDVFAYIFTIFAILLALCWFLLYRRFNYWKWKEIPHEKRIHWLYGNLGGARSRFHEMQIFAAHYEKFKNSGPFAGFYFYAQPIALITDLDLIKNILVQDFDSFSERSLYCNEQQDPLSAHLFALETTIWKNLRCKLTPMFTTDKMQYMFGTLKAVADTLLQQMSQMAANDAGSGIDVKIMFDRFATDVIASCAFGIDCNSLQYPEAEFAAYGRRVFDEFSASSLKLGFAISYPKLARFLRITLTPPAVAKFFLNSFKQSMQHRELNQTQRQDFMNLLLELKNQASDNLTLLECAAQAYSFFVTGFETSSSLATFALYELALHQQLQAKLRLQIKQALSRHNNEFSYACLADMPYLDQIIKETMRLHSVVPILLRKAMSNYRVPGHPTFSIEQGMCVIIPAAAIHMDASIYSNPQQFDPENFAEHKQSQRHAMSWLGFGEGSRNCIGLRFGQMQTRLCLAMLIHQFKFSTGDFTQIPIEIDIKSSFCIPKQVRLRVEKV